MGRKSTALQAFWALYHLPKETVQSFTDSYDLFDGEVVTDNASKIVDYYAVLNYLCSMGAVEKMYIPPIMNPRVGIFENQILFELQMMLDIDIIGANKQCRVLDVGCGRGRIAAHVATKSGASVYGINIDPTQVASAQANALKLHMEDRLFFREGNYNNPLPYEDGFFDALYQVQALTYAKDKVALFREMYRVLKPGSKISFLDWVRLDAFDPTDAHHQQLLLKVKPLIGAVNTPSPAEFTDALTTAGFQIIDQGDISQDGHQADLIAKADDYFKSVTKWVRFLVATRILPKHIKVLFERFIKDGDAFIEADKLKLFTTSYQIIAQKPY
jgi:sterol 24-C-methyltransferase